MGIKFHGWVAFCLGSSGKPVASPKVFGGLRWYRNKVQRFEISGESVSQNSVACFCSVSAWNSPESDLRLLAFGLDPQDNLFGLQTVFSSLHQLSQSNAGDAASMIHVNVMPCVCMQWCWECGGGFALSSISGKEERLLAQKCLLWIRRETRL